MRLFELFSSGNDMMMQLRQDALDVITPYLGQKVPFITVNQVIDGLRSSSDSGIMIDRSLVMDLLDPDEVKAVDKIEGDRIYLADPQGNAQALDVEDKEKDQDKVADMAKNQTKKQQDQVANMAQDQAKKQTQS